MHKGFVLNTELSQKAGVVNSLFCQLNSVVVEHMGHLTIIKKDTLPTKYQKFANECLDLEKYITAAGLSRILGRRHDYISYSIFHETIKPDMMKIGKLNLIKLSDDFLNLTKNKKTPFLTYKKEIYDDDIEIINMYGLKIGFY